MVRRRTDRNPGPYHRFGCLCTRERRSPRRWSRAPPSPPRPHRPHRPTSRSAWPTRPSGCSSLRASEARHRQDRASSCPTTGSRSRATRTRSRPSWTAPTPSDTDVLVHFTARRGCYAQRQVLEAQGLPRAHVKTYKKNVKRFLREFPETRRDRRLERGEPRLASRRPTSPASPRSTSSPPARPAGLQDRRRRRPRLHEHGVLAERLRPQGQGQGQHLRPAQLLRRQPQALQRHDAACCARSAARCG